MKLAVWKKPDFGEFARWSLACYASSIRAANKHAANVANGKDLSVTFLPRGENPNSLPDPWYYMKKVNL